MRNLFIFLMLTLCFFRANANPVQQALAEFRKHKLVEIDLQKKATNELDGTTTVVAGRGYFSGQKFRIDLDPPEKSRVVFDGDIFWVVQFPAEGATGPVQVFKRSGRKVGSEQRMISSLLGKGIVPKELKLNPGKNPGEWIAKPKPGQLGAVKEVRLTLKDKQLSAITLVDDLDNQVVYELLKIQGKSRGQAGLFQYRPEKGAVVTHEK